MPSSAIIIISLTLRFICSVFLTERAAREQDNHHYYKIFADSVRKLADKLQGVADVEN